MTNAAGRKISEFVVQTSLLDSDKLTFVRLGNNYSIPYSNFVSGLGVTGSIASQGAVGGIPILDVDGTVNNIRTLTGGAGISISVNASNGLTIDRESSLAQGYMATSTTTTIGAGSGDAGNPIEVNGSTNWVSAQAEDFTFSTDGRATFTGTKSGKFYVSCNITGTAAATSATFSHYIAKNAVTVTASKTTRDYTAGTDGSPAGCVAIVDMVQNDYLELYVENATNTEDWVSDNLNFVVYRVE